MTVCSCFRRLHSSFALRVVVLALVALALTASDAFADSARAKQWRGECCEEPSLEDDGETATCEELRIKTHCCVSKNTQCKTGCEIGQYPDGVYESREKCEEACEKDGLDCLDEGEIADAMLGDLLPALTARATAELGGIAVALKIECLERGADDQCNKGRCTREEDPNSPTGYEVESCAEFIVKCDANGDESAGTRNEATCTRKAPREPDSTS